MSFQPSPVRRALDYLLDAYPMFDLVSIDWQLTRTLYAESTPQRRWTPEMAGPWVLITLGQPSMTFEDEPAWAKWPFAVWKHTGALYAVQADGAVSDDPIWTPSA